MKPSTFPTHPDYDKFAPLWVRCSDCIEGQYAIKSAASTYLLPLETASGIPDAANYKDYLHRAVFYGATGSTAQALCGEILRKHPTVEFPESKKGLLLDLGASQESLTQMIQSSVSAVVFRGRVGHLVDATEDGTPHVAEYSAASILYWRSSVVAGKHQLSFLVLRELVTELDTSVDLAEVPLEPKTVLQFRVLSLEDTGDSGAVYRQRLYRQIRGRDGVPYLRLRLDIEPTRFGGRTYDFIPFRITGTSPSSDLSPSVPPLLAVADVNLSHYNNSADLEHGLHYTALPTPWIRAFGLKRGESLTMGSRTAWATENPEAEAKMLEFTGQGLSSIIQVMENKKKEMAILGARLFEEGKQAESGAALDIRQSGNLSVLRSIANALTASWTWILNVYWSAVSVVDSPSEISVEMNTDFQTSRLSSNDLIALMQQVQAGMLSWDSYFYNLKAGEMYPTGRTAEEEASLIQGGGPNPSGVPGTSGPFPPEGG